MIEIKATPSERASRKRKFVGEKGSQKNENETMNIKSKTLKGSDQNITEKQQKHADALQSNNVDAGNIKPKIKSKMGNFNHAKNSAKGKPHHASANKPVITLDRKGHKELRKKRRAQRPNAEMCASAVKMWEELRREDCERRAELCASMYDLVKSNIKSLLCAHDTSRVIQTLLKYANEAQCSCIFSEVKDELGVLIKCKYARFIIKKILKYGTKVHKQAVFQSFVGCVIKLLKARGTALILQHAYDVYAVAPQRAAIMREIYGPVHYLFHDQTVDRLSQALDVYPAQKDMILSFIKDVLMKAAKKNLFSLTLIHHTLLEFLQQSVTCESPRVVSALQEVITGCKESLVTLSESRDGVKAAMIILWRCNAKDRKQIMKSLKTFVVNMCNHEHAYLFMLALCDCVDDVVLLSKIVLKELLESLDEVAKSEHGCKVLLYLLARRDPHYFNKQIIDLLLPGDLNAFSKKPALQRAREILCFVAPTIIHYTTENMSQLLHSNRSAVLVGQVMLLNVVDNSMDTENNSKLQLAISDKLQLCRDRLVREFNVKYCSKPVMRDGEISMDIDDKQDSEEHLIENAAMHIILKRIIKEQESFRKTLIEHVSADVLLSWTECNRGCHLLLELLNCDGAMKDVMKQIVKSPVFCNKLKTLSSKGAHLLLEHVLSL